MGQPWSKSWWAVSRWWIHGEIGAVLTVDNSVLADFDQLQAEALQDHRSRIRQLNDELKSALSARFRKYPKAGHIDFQIEDPRMWEAAKDFTLFLQSVRHPHVTSITCTQEGDAAFIISLRWTPLSDHLIQNLLLLQHENEKTIKEIKEEETRPTAPPPPPPPHTEAA